MGIKKNSDSLNPSQSSWWSSSGVEAVHYIFYYFYEAIFIHCKALWKILMNGKFETEQSQLKPHFKWEVL